MLAMSRDLGVQYKTSFRSGSQDAGSDGVRDAGRARRRRGPQGRNRRRLFRRLRQAREPSSRTAGIVGLRQNQSGKRKVVVVIRERDGKTLPGVFASEVAALNFIRTRIARGTEVYADEAGAWNELHGRFTMHRINHQEAYSLGDGIHSNNAESFFSRMRRGGDRPPSPSRRPVSDPLRAGSFVARGSPERPERRPG